MIIRLIIPVKNSVFPVRLSMIGICISERFFFGIKNENDLKYLTELLRWMKATSDLRESNERDDDEHEEKQLSLVSSKDKGKSTQRLYPMQKLGALFQ